MRKVLKEACRRYAPEGIVEVRPKSLSSFAEKAIRKREGHDDPVHQFTDLCGARVITHTQGEVDLICGFIRENFKIDEANSPDIRSRLQTAEFGYLSVHFVVQVKGDSILGIPVPKEIGDRKAEVQVRTLLQHAYAGVTHDRLYKSEFAPPEHLKRDLARVAAILEEADGTLAQGVERLDAYKLNYGTFLEKEDREKEIKALKTVLKYEPVESNKPRTALRLVRILKQTWQWEKIKPQLDPFVNLACLEKAEIA
jgi:ppGpp synthetase/RelA/SpoT-type nucleotidyltranferase